MSIHRDTIHKDIEAVRAEIEKLDQLMDEHQECKYVGPPAYHDAPVWLAFVGTSEDQAMWLNKRWKSWSMQRDMLEIQLSTLTYVKSYMYPEESV